MIIIYSCFLVRHWLQTETWQWNALHNSRNPQQENTTRVTDLAEEAISKETMALCYNIRLRITSVIDGTIAQHVIQRSMQWCVAKMYWWYPYLKWKETKLSTNQWGLFQQPSLDMILGSQLLQSLRTDDSHTKNSLIQSQQYCPEVLKTTNSVL